MSIPEVPAQCRCCVQWDKEECICKIYDFLPGESGRESVTNCPSFYEASQKNELELLAQYIDEDPDQLVEQRLNNIVSRIVTGYEEKFKIMVVGIARRKIKAMIKMVDVIDILLDKLSEKSTLDEMTPSQSIKLLGELNSHINTDLAFVMQLVNPDTKLQDLQMWVDARSVININNGASPSTEQTAESILNMTNASRGKIREAFDALLQNIPEEEDFVEEHIPSAEEEEELSEL